MRYRIALVLALLSLTCKKEPPPAVQVPTLALQAIDASCTEAWLKATTSQIPATVRLIRLTPTPQAVQTLQLTTPDTLLIDEGLLPRQTYSYQLQKLAADSTVVETSPSVQLTTMDTTSHNFNWQIDTLGDGAGSVLYDVAIINDTLVYAVGEIWKRDSIGNWINPPFNIAKWNGQRWELMRRLYDCRLYYPTCGPGYFLYTPIRSIFAFAPNDIWIAAGTAQHFDGVRWTEHAGIEGVGGAYKIWGTSSNDLYFVGYGGFIAHYDGTRWRRIESGTTLDIRDIWGATNPRTGQLEILALASTVTIQTQESRIIQITSNSVVPVDNTGLSPDLSGVWFAPGKRYYAVGAGVHQKRSLRDSLWVVYPPGVVTHFYSGGIRGTAFNDLFAGGAFGEVVHFNGSSWFRYFSYMPFPAGGYGSLSMSENLVVAVGFIGTGISSKAIVLLGRR